jgi:hypothetical protein
MPRIVRPTANARRPSRSPAPYQFVIMLGVQKPVWQIPSNSCGPRIFPRSPHPSAPPHLGVARGLDGTRGANPRSTLGNPQGHPRNLKIPSLLSCGGCKRLYAPCIPGKIPSLLETAAHRGEGKTALTLPTAPLSVSKSNTYNHTIS